VTATDGDKDRPQNIVYFLTGQGIDPDNPANSKFDINRTSGEIFVLKVNIRVKMSHAVHFLTFPSRLQTVHSLWTEINPTAGRSGGSRCSRKTKGAKA